jgi:hypothetical protein
MQNFYKEIRVKIETTPTAKGAFNEQKAAYTIKVTIENYTLLLTLLMIYHNRKQAIQEYIVEYKNG